MQKNNYIKIAPTGEIDLTELGLKKATEIYERHHVITELLIKLGANEEIAEENACRIEHVISTELFEILKKNIKD